MPHVSFRPLDAQPKYSCQSTKASSAQGRRVERKLPVSFRNKGGETWSPLTAAQALQIVDRAEGTGALKSFGLSHASLRGMFVHHVVALPPIARPDMMLVSKNTRVPDPVTVSLLNLLAETERVRSGALDEPRLQACVDAYFSAVEARLRGKEGRVRGNLLGKRANLSARAVVTGDPTLSLEEVGVPREIADRVLVLERVHRHNLDACVSLVMGAAAFAPGSAVYVIDEHGVERPASLPGIRVSAGCAILRPLRDGDWVAFGRQPSLHRNSLMGHRVRVMEHGLTFRLNLAATSPYNADFDGDEMNLHAPTGMALAEVRTLMAVSRVAVSPSASRPVIGLVQDALLAAYLMTADDVEVRHVDATQMAVACGVDLHASHPREGAWTGRQVISLALPLDLTHDAGSWAVVDGDLVRGRLGKAVLGATAEGGLLHVVWRQLGPDAFLRTVDRLQTVCVAWLSLVGFGVSLRDLESSSTDAAGVARAARIGAAAAVAASAATSEANAIAALDATRDAENGLRAGGFVEMIAAGSKGRSTNLAQMAVCVGQQTIGGARLEDAGQKRVLSHHGRRGERTTMEDAVAMGFVRQSFKDGLGAEGFWMHVTGARENVIETATTASTNGDTTRKAMKFMENVFLAPDGTVRVPDGCVVSLPGAGYNVEGAMARRLLLAEVGEMVDAGDARTLVAALDRPSAPDPSRATIDVPVDIAWHVQKAKRGEGGGDPMDVDVDQDHIDGLIDEATKALTSCFPGNKIVRRIFEAMIIREGPLTPDALNRLKVAVLRDAERARAEHGEAVGCIAVQVLAEQALQATMNTHQTAGQAAAGVCSRSDRVKQLLESHSSPKAMLRAWMPVDGIVDRAAAERDVRALVCVNLSAVGKNPRMLSKETTAEAIAAARAGTVMPVEDSRDTPEVRRLRHAADKMRQTRSEKLALASFLRTVVHGDEEGESPMSVCPYVRMSVCPYVRMSVCPYVRMSVCPYVILMSLRPSYYLMSTMDYRRGGGRRRARGRGRGERTHRRPARQGDASVVGDRSD